MPSCWPLTQWLLDNGLTLELKDAAATVALDLRPWHKRLLARVRRFFGGDYWSDFKAEMFPLPFTHSKDRENGAVTIMERVEEAVIEALSKHPERRTVCSELSCAAMEELLKDFRCYGPYIHVRNPCDPPPHFGAVDVHTLACPRGQRFCIQATPDVIRLVVGELPSWDGERWRCIVVPQLRTDVFNNLGVVHQL